MRFRHNNIGDIMAARKKEYKRGKIHLQLTRSQTNNAEENEGKIGMILKRQQFGVEQKHEVLQEIQCKYRINFGPRFPIQSITWKIVHNPTVLENRYDCYKQSYFILDGKITVSRDNPLRQSSSSYRENQQLNGQRGIGMLFGDNSLRKCTITAENAVILSIPHPNGELSEISRQVLMTKKEKKISIRQFKLFNNVDSFEKYFIPYLQPAKFSKGQYIYKIGEEANDFFLVVQGEIAMETQVESHVLMKPNTINLVDLIRKRKEELFMVTEVLNKGCYFGQEQILNEDLRRQNAKCQSINCLLLTLPSAKVTQLLNDPIVLQSLQSSSKQRQLQRINKLQIYNKVKHTTPNSELDYTQFEQKYQKFKVRVHRNLTEQRQELLNKLSLHRQKKKIMHGHCVKLNDSPQKNRYESFSMLEVNPKTYSSTIKRFRHSLNQIQKDRQPKQRIQLKKGRSLEDVWHSLHLQKLLQNKQIQTKPKIYHENCNGMQYYQTCHRFNKRKKVTHSCQPKSFSTNWKLKKDYVSYLGSLL